MRRAPWWRLAAALLLAAALSACAVVSPPAPPKLVVLLVIDGLPQRQLAALRDQLAPDGIARLLERGASFGQAHFGHAFTVTASGHAVLLTGAYADRTGIIGNEWRNLETGERIYCTADAGARYIGHATEAMDGTSPANLMVESLGDVLRRQDARSKVIAVAGKDRSAILPAGRSGTAYMYMDDTGQFASTTWYMASHPAWVDAFHAARPADRWFRAQWKPLLPEAAYARSVPDDQPWFGARGGRLPMTMGSGAGPTPAYYAELLPSPFADALTLEFARAAVSGEQLGGDDAPDLLAISLSGHDYVNHRWSAESRLSHDHLLQVDRQLQAFFRELDAAVGPDNYVAVLTSDHGFMPAPAVSRARGQEGGSVPAAEMLARVNARLEQHYGLAKVVRFISASALVLDRPSLAGQGLDLARVMESARQALAAEPAIAAAYTRDELASGSRAGAPLFDQMRRSWNAQRSGDVQYALRPHWMLAASGLSATHGSAHDYDTHVPLLFWGPRWVRAGEVAERVEMTGLAPTLARMLRIPVPAASEGRVLPLP